MRLSDFIITYLAAAAPFGVAHFLHLRDGVGTSRAAARAALVALVWPATAAVLLLGRRFSGRSGGGGAASKGGRRIPDEELIERTNRALLGSLMDVEALCEAADGGVIEKTRHAVFAARTSVERHAGLSLAASQAESDTEGDDHVTAPAARETELCRIAGRTGDDLLVAGRCVHRRNVTRLLLHRERARAEALHALAALRELMDALPRSTRPDALALRDVSAALLRCYGQAVELFSLLEDRRAVLGAARLLDAECKRLRDLEDLLLVDAREGAPGDVTCTTPAELTAFATDALLTGGTRTHA